jgi:hypothetical protein
MVEWTFIDTKMTIELEKASGGVPIARKHGNFWMEKSRDESVYRLPPKLHKGANRA